MTARLHPLSVHLMTAWCVVYPLWSDDEDLTGPIGADELGLTTALATELAAWNRTWEDYATRCMDGATSVPAIEVEHRDEGGRLVERVQHELGSGTHVYLHASV